MTATIRKGTDIRDPREREDVLRVTRVNGEAVVLVELLAETLVLDVDLETAVAELNVLLLLLQLATVRSTLALLLSGILLVFENVGHREVLRVVDGDSRTGDRRRWEGDEVEKRLVLVRRCRGVICRPGGPLVLFAALGRRRRRRLVVRIAGVAEEVVPAGDVLLLLGLARGRRPILTISLGRGCPALLLGLLLLAHFALVRLERRLLPVFLLAECVLVSKRRREGDLHAVSSPVVVAHHIGVATEAIGDAIVPSRAEVAEKELPKPVPRLLALGLGPGREESRIVLLVDLLARKLAPSNLCPLGGVIVPGELDGRVAESVRDEIEALVKGRCLGGLVTEKMRTGKRQGLRTPINKTVRHSPEVLVEVHLIRDEAKVKDVGCALKFGALALGVDVRGSLYGGEGGDSIVVPGNLEFS